MIERERLIELLQNWGNKENDSVRAESIADYLLEHGVIVPACKVGDIIEEEKALKSGATNNSDNRFEFFTRQCVKRTGDIMNYFGTWESIWDINPLRRERWWEYMAEVPERRQKQLIGLELEMLYSLLREEILDLDIRDCDATDIKERIAELNARLYKNGVRVNINDELQD